MRERLRDAIAGVWGAYRVEGDADGFQPHVSLAYIKTPRPADDEIVVAVDRVTVEPVEVCVDTVTLIELYREGRLYKWRNVEQLSLRACKDTDEEK